MSPSIQRILILLVIGVFDMSIQQNMRVAPGVPPQHYDHQQQFQQPPQGYQQPPPPQYQQQQQQQQYGQPVHVQQPMGHHPQQGHVQQPPHIPQQVGHVPQQAGHGHVQQPVPGGQVPLQGQPPQGHGRHHGEHGHGQFGLDASNVASERKHIQEHMDLPIDTSQMSEQELQFHYFKMHDADNNNKLDGCELVKSLIHWHDQANHDPQAGVPIPEAKVFKDDELSNMIDPILANDDKNKDGFIDYGEFVQAQAQAATRQAENPPAA